MRQQREQLLRIKISNFTEPFPVKFPSSHYYLVEEGDKMDFISHKLRNIRHVA